MDATAICVLVVAAILLAFMFYSRGAFGHHGHHGHHGHQKSNFVGAYGRHPDMMGCLVARADGSMFNRCTYA